MATKMTLVDDLDDTEGAATHTFSLDGVHYAIDLSAGNFLQLQGALNRYISVARRERGGSTARGNKATSAASSGSSRPSTAPSGVNTKEVRKWAMANGIQMNDRGRVPVAIIEQYTEAMKGGGDSPSTDQDSTGSSDTTATATKRTARNTTAKKATAGKATAGKRGGSKATAASTGS